MYCTYDEGHYSEQCGLTHCRESVFDPLIEELQDAGNASDEDDEEEGEGQEEKTRPRSPLLVLAGGEVCVCVCVCV